MRSIPQLERIAPFANRDEAALLLAAKLEDYRNADALVLTVPPGGLKMGDQIAERLGIRSMVMPCREIRHPANRNQSIGSVCLRNVVLHDAGSDIPQEYIQHAIARLRARIQRDRKEGAGDIASESYRGKTLIIVSDWLKTADRILACLNHMRKDNPARIVVATAVISRQAIPTLRGLADELIYLVEDDEVSLPQYYFGPEQGDTPPVPALGPTSRENVQSVRHYA
jgi:predicted phosphoribosyltransferase